MDLPLKRWDENGPLAPRNDGGYTYRGGTKLVADEPPLWAYKNAYGLPDSLPPSIPEVVDAENPRCRGAFALYRDYR